jgi:glycosyltransferase involved in cell wall biosynthesis
MMRLLLIHPEPKHFAGAEAMLVYFLEGLLSAPCEVVVAISKEGAFANRIPNRVEQIRINDNLAFSIAGLSRQIAELTRHHRLKPFDIIHGWAARDWELAALLGHWVRRPAVGTLHDHPQARFISSKRRFLMRWSARCGLGKVVCVSEAVRRACLAASYPKNKLQVVHNGLPDFPAVRPAKSPAIFRLGFLGAFSVRKGLQLLFEIASVLSNLTPRPWELHLAGDAQEDASRQWLEQIRQRFSQECWWSQVHWHGWVDEPIEFLKSLDLLIVPSSEFDPLPTVLLEAGGVGLPVLAARVGGVEEIVIANQTGWLFERGNCRQAADILSRLLAEPDQLRLAGLAAFQRIRAEFSIGKMVDNYLKAYSNMQSNV